MVVSPPTPSASSSRCNESELVECRKDCENDVESAFYCNHSSSTPARTKILSKQKRSIERVLGSRQVNEGHVERCLARLAQFLKSAHDEIHVCNGESLWLEAALIFRQCPPGLRIMT